MGHRIELVMAATDSYRLSVKETPLETDGAELEAIIPARALQELSRVAQSLPSPVDRYWMLVYTLVAETPASVPSWRVIPFMGVMQAAFQIVDTDMELAVIDALTFPANLPRP